MRAHLPLQLVLLQVLAGTHSCSCTPPILPVVSLQLGWLGMAGRLLSACLQRDLQDTHLSCVMQTNEHWLWQAVWSLLAS